MAVATITAICAAILPSAQAQAPSGRYQAQSGQILFYPASGANPVVVYNAGGRAVAITPYDGAIYTAFDGGYIYRSPDGQNLGGGGNTSRVYRGSGTVNRMQCINGNVVLLLRVVCIKAQMAIILAAVGIRLI